MTLDWLIVGAGFAGATVAEHLATELNKKILVIDRRFHIGGNAFYYFDAARLMVHKYGPHIGNTYSKTVWDYLSRFSEWRPYYHHVLIKSLIGKVLFAGRLADYKYYNMNQAAARALHVFQNIAAQRFNFDMSRNVVSA